MKYRHIIILFLLCCISLYANSQKHISCEELLKNIENTILDKKIIQSLYYMELLDNVYPCNLTQKERIHYIELHNILSKELLEQKQFSKALKVVYKGIDISLKDDYTLELPEMYKTAGTILSNIKDNSSAIKYYRQSLELAQEQDNYSIMVQTLANLALVSYSMNNLNDARQYFNQMVLITETDTNQSDINQQYIKNFTWAAINKLENNYDTAFYYFKKSLSDSQSSNLPLLYITSCNLEIADLYLSINQLDSAQHYYLQTIEIARTNNLPEELTKSYYSLARIAEKRNQTDLAYSYQKQYIEISDSIFNYNEIRQIEENRFINTQIENQSYIDRLSIQVNKRSKWLIIFSILLLATIIILVLIYYQKKRMSIAYKDLYQRNQELLRYENLYYDIKTGQELTKDDKKEKLDESNKKSISYQINNIQKEKILSAIKQCIKDKSIICNPDLSLEQFANYTNTNSKYLSQIINETYGQNFRSFISEYRIREAQRMLNNTKQYGHYTIQAIGEAVGYRSQSSFIAVFKEKTGLTPSIYQKLSYENKEKKNDLNNQEN